MFTAYVVAAVVTSLALLGSAFGKLTKQKQVVDNLTGVGVPVERFPVLAGIEAVGAAGLIVGIWVAGIGVAAAIGVVLYFVLAIGAHVRAKDVKNIGPAGFYLVLGVLSLIFRIAA